MPHSSGGGSHSGGSHGGGSHGGSHGGRHSSVNGVRVSKRPFINSNRYRYRKMGGGYGYIYANREPGRMSVASFVFSILFLCPFLFVGIFVVVPVAFPNGIFNKALTPEYSDNGNYIEDNIGVIDNYSQLNETLGEFQDLTGVCPYIITVSRNDWENYYNSLENYAYDLYVNHFYDEQHFLIVYSEAEVYDNGFVDWSWEGMQGDDTDSIITSGKFSEFQDDLQRYLTMNDYSVGEAFNKTFSNSLEYIMENSFNMVTALPVIIFAVVWNCTVIFVLINLIVTFVRGRRGYEKVPFSETASDYNTNKGYNQDMFNEVNQGANMGYNQDTFNDFSQGTNMENRQYGNGDWNIGRNNPYSGKMNK